MLSWLSVLTQSQDKEPLKVCPQELPYLYICLTNTFHNSMATKIHKLHFKIQNVCSCYALLQLEKALVTVKHSPLGLFAQFSIVQKSFVTKI